MHRLAIQLPQGSRLLDLRGWRMDRIVSLFSLPMKFSVTFTDYPAQPQTNSHSTMRSLERNVIYRGASHSGNQSTSIQRGLHTASRNEQYVLVPNRNVLSFAT